MDRYRIMPSYRFCDVEGVSPLTIEKSVGKSLRDYKIYGNSVQDGIPTPDNPIEIQSVGDLILDEIDPYFGKYKIPVEVRGKNLFNVSEWLDASKYSVSNAANSVSVVGNKITISNIANVSLKSNTLKYLKPNTTYYISVKKRTVEEGDTSSTTFRVALVARYNSSASNFYMSYGGNGKFKTPADLSEYEYLCLFASANGVISFDSIQIEEGVSATEYEPYKEPMTTNIYLDEPLYKIGDYADYIDFKNGKVVRNISKYVADGRGWYKNGETGDGLVRYFIGGILPVGTAGMRQVLSNVYPFTSRRYDSNWYELNTINAWGFTSQTGWMGCCVSIEEFPTVEDFKNFLATKYNEGNPLKLYYSSTPTETPITLPTIPTHKDTNVISVDADIQPSNMQIQYYR